MALLVAIALAVAMLIATVVNRPPPVYAEVDQAETPAPAPKKISPRKEAKTASVPLRGKASSPYDMDALREFDAGSHR